MAAGEYNLSVQILDTIPMGICVFTYDHILYRYIHCNSYFFKMFSNIPEPSFEDGAFTPYDYMHEDDIEEYKEVLEKAYLTGKEFSVRKRILSEGGIYKWYSIKGSVTKESDTLCCMTTTYTDIDNLVKTQDQLKLTEQIKNIALDSEQLVIWRYDPKTKANSIISGNSLLTKKPVVENVPESSIQNGFVKNTSIDDYRELFAAADRGERVTKRILLFDGQYNAFRWKQITFIPMSDRSGDFSYAIGCSKDIDRQVKEEQRFNEKICSVTAANQNTLGVFRFDLTKNRCFDGYSRFSQVLKMAEKGTVDGYYEYAYAVSPDKKELADFKKEFNREALIKAYEGGRSTIQREHKVYDPNGKVCWISSVVELAKNPVTGDIEGVTYSTDITKTKTMEALLSAVIDVDYDMLCVFNAENGILSSLHQSSNFSLTDLSDAKNISDITDRYEKLMSGSGEKDSAKAAEVLSREAIVKELAEKPVCYAAYSITAPDGKEYRKYNSYCYLDDSHFEICCIQHDITEVYLEQKQRSEQLTAALKEAERANAAKSEFLSRMSHEIRTPMNAVIGIADFGAEESTEPAIKDYFTKIKSSADYLLGILNDILDMSKIENGKVTLYPKPCKLEDFAESVNTIILPLMQKKNIDFRFELHDIYADTLIMDDMRVKQIFINLLSNSAKFTPDKGRVDFTVSQMPGKDSRIKTIFTVRDTGIGMSEEFIEHIYEPFVQERTVETSSVQGTGLGLPISKNLVEIMGGTMSIESKLGEGTKITAEIEFDSAAAVGAQNQPNAAEFDFSGKRALIIEDHSINRILAVKVLKKAGFEADSAANGLEGLKKFMDSEDGYYDVVLMDIRMPVMGGLEAVRKIRALNRVDAKKVIILAMSANAYPEDIQNSLDAGMNGHVAKPIIPALLLSEIERNIESADAEKP